MSRPLTDRPETPCPQLGGVGRGHCSVQVALVR